MPKIHDPLILDLVAWVAERPRPYADVMDAWRTSYPRLPVWEDAVDCGLVRRLRGGLVEATPAGLAMLSLAGRLSRPAVSRPERLAC